MINKSNYYLASKARFSAIPMAVLKKAVDADFPAFLTINGRRWTLDHVSEVSVYNRYLKKSSVYYISEDEKWLIRISDHWCGEYCHAIRNCYWRVARSNCGNAYKEYLGGIVAFADMRER